MAITVILIIDVLPYHCYNYSYHYYYYKNCPHDQFYDNYKVIQIITSILIMISVESNKNDSDYENYINDYNGLCINGNHSDNDDIEDADDYD